MLRSKVMIRFRAAIAPAFIIALLALVSADPLAAQASAYPSRTIRLVVGFSPGGGIDVVARLFAEKLTSALGQPVVVENRPGASGSVAGRQVAGAEPDGHTVLVNSNSMIVNLIMSPAAPLDVERDLVPIVRIAPQSIILAAAPDLPVKSLGELLALAALASCSTAHPESVPCPI